MRQRRRLWVGALALLMAVAWVGLAAAQGTGDRVVGTVANGTPGGVLPVGAPVTLQFFSEGAPTRIYTTTLEADGSFRFEDLSAEVGGNFRTGVIYRDVAYFSQPAKLEGGEAVADISIYESTEDIAGVRVDQVHLFIVPLGDRVRVVEVYLAGNSGERTYVGTLREGQGRRTTLSFTVPSGATAFEFEDRGLGERFLGDSSAFDDTMPIPPGIATTEVSFGYELAYRDGMEIARTVGVPVTSVVIVVNGSDLGVEGAGVAFAGTIDTQMGQVASYTAGPLQAGAPLVLRFVPQTNTDAVLRGEAADTSTGRMPREREPATEAVIGAVVLAGTGIGAYLFWRRRSIPPVPEAVRETIVALAALDRRYAEGVVDGTEYAREREALMCAVRAALQRRA